MGGTNGMLESFHDSTPSAMPSPPCRLGLKDIASCSPGIPMPEESDIERTRAVLVDVVAKN